MSAKFNTSDLGEQFKVKAVPAKDNYAAAVAGISFDNLKDLGRAMRKVAECDQKMIKPKIR